MIKNNVKKWFVIQIKPNSYELANRNLKRQEFETFFPKIRITKRIKNKFIIKEVYVFFGYVFVCFNPKLTDWSKINNTYGVSKILTFNGKPAEIDSDLVLELKNRYAFNKNILEHDNLQKGDRIKINTGPFADLFAKVESVERQNGIWVLLEFAGAMQKLKLAPIKQNYKKVELKNTKL